MEKTVPLPRSLWRLRGPFILGNRWRDGQVEGQFSVLETADRKVMQVRLLSPPPLFSTTYTLVSPSGSLRELFGSVDLGYPTGADNESTDADLAREYPGRQEKRRRCCSTLPACASLFPAHTSAADPRGCLDRASLSRILS